MKINFEKLKISLLIILGVVLVVNLFLIGGINNKTDKKVEEIKELTRPVNLELTIIKDENCKDCFDLTPTIESIRNANTNIIKEEVKDVKEAKALIEKYGIKKIPTIILSGEINRTELSDFEEKENILLFKKQNPPYVDTVSGKIMGRVSLIHIKDGSCNKCSDINDLIAGLEEEGVSISNKKTVEWSSENGKELIKRYDIKQVPTLILSNDISAYESISQVWDNIGTVEKDGSYIVRRIAPPFVNVSTSSIVGLVDLIILEDKSCSECYDATLHKNILKQFGVVLGNEKTADIISEEGKRLIEKYNVKAVPTIILSKDADNYPQLVQVWAQVGSIENDGSFIFREMTALGGSVYRDLTTNKVVG